MSLESDATTYPTESVPLNHGLKFRSSVAFLKIVLPVDSVKFEGIRPKATKPYVLRFVKSGKFTPRQR